MASILDQLSDVALIAVAALIGGENCAAFRNHLRTMPPLPDGFTLGDVAREYLKSRLAYLQSLD